jgi:hypothetical protein
MPRVSARTALATALLPLAAACSELGGLAGGDAGATSGDAASPCSESVTMCGGKCVSLQSDPNNCGQCGFLCGTGRVCRAGACHDAPPPAADGGSDATDDGGSPRDATSDAPLAAETSTPELLFANVHLPYDLATDGTNLFWTENLNADTPTGNVTRGSLDGGARTPIATDQTDPSRLVLDKDTAYWIQRPDAGSGVIMKVPLAGGAPTPIANFANPSALAVDADYVFVLSNPSTYTTTDGALTRMSKTGASQTPIASGLRGSAGAMALDEANVYYGTQSGIAKVAKTGGMSTIIVPSATTTTNVAIDSSALFWANSVFGNPDTTGYVQRSATDGSGSMQLASATWEAPAGITMIVANDAVYWTAPLLQEITITSELMRVAKTGGPSQDLHVQGAASMASDATYLYWTDYSASSIFRMRK